MKKIARMSALVLAGMGAALFAAPAGAAVCTYPESNCSVEVEAVTLEPEVVAVAAPAAPAVAVAGKQQLPVTGTDVVYLAGGGAALLASGLFLTRRAKVAGSTSH